MAFRLVLTDAPMSAAAGATLGDEKVLGPAKDVGENVFLDNLSAEYRVFLFYYPAEMPNPALENRLRKLGESAGKNLFVNMGTFADPNYAKIVKRFGIERHPVIVMTAAHDLAGPSDDFATTYVRLDSKHLLGSPDRTADCLQQLFDLFIQGRVADAIRKGKWTERKGLAAAVGNVFVQSLKVVGDFILSRDITVSVMEGKFELKRSGE